MDKIILDVTQEDIDKGTKHSTTYCPVALSLRRIYPKAKLVTVGVVEASVYTPRRNFLGIIPRGEEFIRITLPKRVSKFIRNYDAYGAKDEYVKPFTVEVEIERIRD